MELGIPDMQFIDVIKTVIHLTEIVDPHGFWEKGEPSIESSNIEFPTCNLMVHIRITVDPHAR